MLTILVAIFANYVFIADRDSCFNGILGLLWLFNQSCLKLNIVGVFIVGFGLAGILILALLIWFFGIQIAFCSSLALKLI